MLGLIGETRHSDPFGLSIAFIINIEHLCRCPSYCVGGLSDLYFQCSVLVQTGFELFPNTFCPQSNRELEGCAMNCCEKYIAVAQSLILEAYLKTRPFRTVRDHRASKLAGS